jgi:hypothetical protein
MECMGLEIDTLQPSLEGITGRLIRMAHPALHESHGIVVPKVANAAESVVNWCTCFTGTFHMVNPSDSSQQASLYFHSCLETYLIWCWGGQSIYALCQDSSYI